MSQSNIRDVEIGYRLTPREPNSFWLFHQSDCEWRTALRTVK